MRSIKGAPGISGILVVKSKLPPQSGCGLEAVEPHPQKGAVKFLSFFVLLKTFLNEKTYNQCHLTKMKMVTTKTALLIIFK